MLKVFDEVGTLDQKCYTKYGLSEDILMEHAASSMLDLIEQKFDSNSKILIVSGSGNNGADGIALARLLQGKFDVELYLASDVKSDMAKLQLQRAKKVDVKIISTIAQNSYDVVVDCLFGSGLNKELNSKYISIIEQMNNLLGYKISCDIPSGINALGQIMGAVFKADTTVTMGSLKKSLFTDNVKDFVSDIIVANLGVQKELYEDETDCFLLQKSDLVLPFRTEQNKHKGSFGHLAVVSGDKVGASILSSQAGFSFGAGLVTIVSKENLINIPAYIMQNKNLPQNTTAIAIGMGLANSFDIDILPKDIAKVFDADLFYDSKILDFFYNDNIVLTPHPKEFCSLLKISGIDDIDISTLQNNRFKYLSLFCKKYPKVVLLLKGANVLIAQDNKIYINQFGDATLSKGGSGDVLSGLIGGLLAQGYSSLDATICGSLAHSLAIAKYDNNNYSLNPYDLIELVKKL